MDERLKGEFIVAPDPADLRLAKVVTGIEGPVTDRFIC
jgi:hypothetical protein